MAINWVNKGNLKGPQGETGEKGDQGIQGFGVLKCSVALTASASVEKTNITPNTNIQKGDTVIDINGDMYEITTVSDSTVNVGDTKFTSIKGPQGPKGDAGEKGEDGTGVNIKGAVSSSSDLPGSGEDGDAYIVNETGNLWVWSSDEGKFVDTGAQIKGPKGDAGAKGDPGTAATIQVGTVQTGEPGTQASVVNAGDTTNARFNFTIPRGAQGVAGPGIQVGSGAPSQPGTSGECYIDITTGDVYRYEESE